MKRCTDCEKGHCLDHGTCATDDGRTCDKYERTRLEYRVRVTALR